MKVGRPANLIKKFLLLELKTIHLYDDVKERKIKDVDRFSAQKMTKIYNLKVLLSIYKKITSV